ncbi:MAG: plasmid mobilization relaxosome protein MobC [Ekhidna sp.]|nr:plasmid mobilization relaxosome protein MobC [Ekhidna sp.]
MKDYSENKKAYETRFKKVTLRFTEKEHQQILKKKGDLSLTEYIKFTVLSTRKSVFGYSEQDKMFFKSTAKELSLIGNNINQIARNTNIETIKQGGNPNETAKELDRLLPLLYQLILETRKKL